MKTLAQECSKWDDLRSVIYFNHNASFWGPKNLVEWLLEEEFGVRYERKKLNKINRNEPFSSPINEQYKLHAKSLQLTSGLISSFGRIPTVFWIFYFVNTSQRVEMNCLVGFHVLLWNSEPLKHRYLQLKSHSVSFGLKRFENERVRQLKMGSRLGTCAQMAFPLSDVSLVASD